PPRLSPRLPRRGRAHLPAGVRTVLALAIVVILTLAGGVVALSSFTENRDLSIGTIGLSVEPGHRGALDIYVPLVDWGARFPVVELPARLRIDVRAVNRDAVARLAGGQRPNVEAVRHEANGAIGSYIRALVAIVFGAALAVGLLGAFAVR